MSHLVQNLREYCHEVGAAWNRFWFTPEDGHTLSLIRIFTGAMLLYTHAVWSLELTGFFSPAGRVSVEFARQFHDHPAAFSFLSAIDSPTVLWCVHASALSIFFLLMIGCWTRVVSVLAWLLTLSYAHRAPGVLFGLDQINCLLAMYVAVGDSGSVYSIDQWRRRTRGVAPVPSTSTSVAIRLLQIHMCIVYLFAGMGKLQGITWWQGNALWLAFANLEYQSIDMTWLADWPRLIEVMSQITVAWELSYIALVWNRWTRPFVLALAIPLHLGIALCMGMITFGTIMLVGNLAFVSPRLIDRWLGSRLRPANLGNER